ncbi:hypothetical protein [Nocardioides cynanchi]|uniref:hypothetical protein n=1 Tax=Nocardioides cynanchi TaxID=2558918 RepID=UPI001248EB1E|nr:hypothetical protein [Nocardioides cynanchi]
MKRTLGTLLATASLLAVAGCGSSSSTVDGPAGPTAGPITGATVLPLISVTGGGGTVSTSATLLDTKAHIRAFTGQFRQPTMAARVTAAVKQAAGAGKPVYGAVVAVGCDRPPGAVVSLDANGDVQITGEEVASPLQECLAPVTTVALASVPGAD